MTNPTTIYDVIHDVGLAVGGAIVGGLIGFERDWWRAKEERSAEYRRRRRDKLEEIASQFGEMFEIWNQTVSLKSMLEFEKYEPNFLEHIHREFGNLRPATEVFTELRKLISLAQIIDTPIIAENIGEYIKQKDEAVRSIDASQKEQFNVAFNAMLLQERKVLDSIRDSHREG